MTECQERGPPINNSSVSLICMLNTLTNVEAPLLRRVCKADTRLCGSILVPLLQLLEVVTQQGSLIIPAACTLALSIIMRLIQVEGFTTNLDVNTALTRLKR